MFFIIVVLAIIGLFSLFGATVSTALGALGALVIIPIVLFKLLLLMAFLGCAGRAFAGGRRRHGNWSGSYRRWDRPERSEEPQQSPEDRFEDWHRMAHAKDEVDSWAPEA